MPERHSGAKPRVRSLSPDDVTWAFQVPTLTVQRTIADLIEIGIDRSLVVDALPDCVLAGKLVRPDRLVHYLKPLAEANGYERDDGDNFMLDLFDAAGFGPIDE